MEFLDKYLAHTIAFIALVQVWLIAAWRRWILKGSIEFYPSASVEIGFSTFGSTISVPGTLRAKNKHVFVTQMRLRVVRENDKAEHTFSWRAFKANTFDTTTGTHKNIELASGFTIALADPRPINVFFASESFAHSYASEASALQAAWVAFGNKKELKWDPASTRVSLTRNSCSRCSMNSPRRTSQLTSIRA